MNKPQLVAETPRAGKWNHRFIAAPNGSFSDSEVAKMIAAARRNPQGDDYLAVSAETTQSMSGRTGKEILALTGVDVKKLSDSQRQQIIAQLDQHLTDLATLVTEEIDWDKEGQAILVKRPELGEWEKGFVGLPIFTPQQEKKVTVPKKPISNRVKMVGGVVGILLVLGLGIWYKKEESVKEPPGTKSEGIAPSVNPQEKKEEETKTERRKKKKKCIKPLKEKIEFFLNHKIKDFTCSNEMPKITPEKDINSFLNEWCSVKLPKVKNEYNLIFVIENKEREVEISKEEFDGLNENFENLKKCSSVE